MGLACGDWQECGRDGHEWMLGDVCADCVPRMNAVAPWRNRAGALRYLSTASAGELGVLARTAALMLEGGDWWGIHSKNGWVSRLTNAEDALWHFAATDFVSKYDRKQPSISEAFVWFAADDLATELLYHRGWCPHKPWDKHRADEPNNPLALPGEPTLSLLECHCFFESVELYKRPAISASPKTLEFPVRDHPEDGATGYTYLFRSAIDGSQIRFVGHQVFIRGSDA